MTTAEPVEDLLRPLAPQVLGALVRHHGHFDECEDAVQEALIAAARQWPDEGLPDDPRAWLVRVASRRLIDALRRDGARRRREDGVAASLASDAHLAPAADEHPAGHDDTLTLLLLCCHPALTAPSQLALTLRAVGGLTTAEIARAFLVPEATMAQRISRAKQQVRAAGATFSRPTDDRAARLDVVRHVLYLLFNEGYLASSGAALQRADLTAEAIRLTRRLHALLPDDGEVTGLLALMVLTDARRNARVDAAGALVPLAEQDRSRWDRAAIDEGVALVTEALGGMRLGPYQLQAAIAAVHDEAASSSDTDWLQVLALYDLLARVAPNPVVALNRAVAVAMVLGPEAGLAELDLLAGDERLTAGHRLDATKAHLLELAGHHEEALVAFRAAARATTSLPERRHLDGRAARLDRAPARPSSAGRALRPRPAAPTAPDAGPDTPRRA